jgi:hypothetical protein
MLDQIKIASPCSADWGKMEGNDRVRFCSECKKSVFNLSAMTRRDAEALLRKTNGDLCTRLYRRADGTVLTADCPIGLRVKVARVRRRVGWAVSAALSLSTAFAQQGAAVLGGMVKDPTGTGIPKASVTVTNNRTGVKVETSTDDAGHFRISTLGPDVYTVNVSSPGFMTTRMIDLELKGEVDIPVVLRIGEATMGGPMVFERKPWWRRLL